MSTFTNSPLATYSYTAHSKCNPRTGPITKITIHHQAGNLTMDQIKNQINDPAREFSCNYAIDSKGKVGLFVDEAYRSWCSSSRDNDYAAVTIEVANDTGAPYWHVSDAALSALIELCADICRRNGIARLNFTGDKTGNLTTHKMFTATACPGPYLESLLPSIAAQVNASLGSATNTASGSLVRITCNTLNVRKGPGTGYGIATTVCKGEVYTIVEQSGNWGRLKSGAGWIYLPYTEQVESAAANPAETKPEPEQPEKPVVPLYRVAVEGVTIGDALALHEAIQQVIDARELFNYYIFEEAQG